MRFRFITFWFILVMALFLGACEREGPIEQAGENIDEAAEKYAEKLEDTADKAEEKIER